MSYKIEVKDKPGIFDAVGSGIKKDITDLGIKTVRDVRFVQVYCIEGSFSEEQIRKICEQLLVDPISQEYKIVSEGLPPSYFKASGIPPYMNIAGGKRIKGSGEFVVEVAYNPGVMDPVEESTLKGIRDLGIEGATAVKTAKKYLIRGKLSDTQLRQFPRNFFITN